RATTGSRWPRKRDRRQRKQSSPRQGQQQQIVEMTSRYSSKGRHRVGPLAAVDEDYVKRITGGIVRRKCCATHAREGGDLPGCETRHPSAALCRGAASRRDDWAP